MKRSEIAAIIVAGAAAVAITASASDERGTLCAPGYARSQRLPPERYYPIAQQAFARAGVPWAERHGYVLDHVVPLCSGGTWDQDNLQLQRPAEAVRKDQLEIRACKMICAGQITPQQGRAWFADWKFTYQQQFGTQP